MTPSIQNTHLQVVGKAQQQVAWSGRKCQAVGCVGVCQ